LWRIALIRSRSIARAADLEPLEEAQDLCQPPASDAKYGLLVPGVVPCHALGLKRSKLGMTARLSELPRPPAPEPLDAPLGAFSTLRALWRNPIETWTKAHFESPVVTGESVLGKVAVVSDPQAIRRVLVDNAANYRKDALQKRLLGPSLRGGLLEAEAEDWRVQRRTLAPLFTPKIVGSFAPEFNRAAEEMAARLERVPEGQIVDVQREMALVTLNVLGRTIFSGGLGRSEKEVASAISRLLATAGRMDPFDVLNFPEWVPRFSKYGGRAAEDFFDSMIDSLIATRSRLLDRDRAGTPRDVLTLLLEAQDPETGAGLSKTQVRANIMSFIAAGHETTANALTWSLYLLSLSAQWRAALAEEAKDVLQGPIERYAERLVKTKAVIEEAMRLYPPAASMSRQADGPDDLADKRIRRGTLIIISQWVLHRHHLLWENPDRFDPRRFLPGARERIDRFAYLPFGAGPRVCIGAFFSMDEAAIILAHLMRSFSFELQKDHEVMPVQRITLRPAGGMPMILRRRGCH
jgi:cytochrome P450